MSDPISFQVPAELVETIAQRAAELVLKSDRERDEGFIGIDEASSFTDLKKSRIYHLAHLDRIPKHKIGSTLKFDKAELRDWIARGGDVCA